MNKVTENTRKIIGCRINELLAINDVKQKELAAYLSISDNLAPSFVIRAHLERGMSCGFRGGVELTFHSPPPPAAVLQARADIRRKRSVRCARPSLRTARYNRRVCRTRPARISSCTYISSVPFLPPFFS